MVKTVFSLVDFAFSDIIQLFRRAIGNRSLYPCKPRDCRSISSITIS